ncbi:hypothetical protein D9756_009398 [Leucocoprinus leucothites]|uniref:Uncharacterized protein n=1 Tax=Leucocoprinus leucothites TaxID=201217 RepID=A0A8H5CXG0_9AGAR|nr:hypothetical protein D9756_009398 [Leucoagaricus leucothites]
MTLFASTISRNSHTLTSGAPPVLTPPTRIPGLGYILFSKPGVPYENPSIPLEESSHKAEALPQPEHAHEPTEEAHAGSEEPLDANAQRRRELEAEEARKGEEDWVRSGGVLRDAEGRRDWARTDAIREELRLREIEAQIMERWNRYEQRWADVLSRVKAGMDGSDSDALLGFNDIPWPLKPVGDQGLQVEDITIQRVEDFLLESLTVRGTKYTKKDRVRSSFLRWHPDKLGNLLQQVRPEDVEAVSRG